MFESTDRLSMSTMNNRNADHDIVENRLMMDNKMFDNSMMNIDMYYYSYFNKQTNKNKSKIY